MEQKIPPPLDNKRPLVHRKLNQETKNDGKARGDNRLMANKSGRKIEQEVGSKRPCPSDKLSDFNKARLDDILEQDTKHVPTIKPTEKPAA